jgi:hypothetical protein
MHEFKAVTPNTLRAKAGALANPNTLSIATTQRTTEMWSKNLALQLMDQIASRTDEPLAGMIQSDYLNPSTIKNLASLSKQRLERVKMSVHPEAEIERESTA